MEINLCMGCMRPKTQPGLCPFCGFDEAAYELSPHHLPLYTILSGKYLVGKVLGEGGFGITYLGWDLNLELIVAIKEYYPNGFVSRENSRGNTVTLLTGYRAEFFTKGLDKFVDEARRLAKFWRLPGIVAVKDYFQENKTRPVMESLEIVHGAGLIHRDISPDNIMVDADGNVKLLDFGAARNFAANDEKSLSVMLKPGYAPEEQYRSRGKQGPWTDVYGLCATMYRAITGEVPVESLDRMSEDTLKKPSEMGVTIFRQQEDAIMKGLALFAQDRFQNIRQLREALFSSDFSPDEKRRGVVDNKTKPDENYRPGRPDDLYSNKVYPKKEIQNSKDNIYGDKMIENREIHKTKKKNKRGLKILLIVIITYVIFRIVVYLIFSYWASRFYMVNGYENQVYLRIWSSEE